MFIHKVQNYTVMNNLSLTINNGYVHKLMKTKLRQADHVPG